MMFRGVWFLLAALAVAHAVSSGLSPVAGVSMSCGKIGEPGVDMARAEISCTDSLFTAVGAVPLVLLAVLLAAPFIVAGTVLNKRASWLATIALAVFAVYGLLNWTGFWVLLLVGALPGAIIASIVSALQPDFRRTHRYDVDRQAPRQV
ncbi:hypothetical protein CH275_05465 [Rhodococcus sp. 06-235-1A]|nr:hypothetical protein CH275_05465 [Rhodococcus sp. 06-235-1A]